MHRIIPFKAEYRDDAIFCFLLAKDALGIGAVISNDLLDIQKNYFDRGDMFWVALDENNRVIGMIGTYTVSQNEAWLKRLFIKPGFKRNGLGSALLAVAEEFVRSKNVRHLHTRFSNDFMEAPQFYAAKGFVEVDKSNGLRHFVKTMEVTP